jgi:hypothetical protein
VTAPLTQALEVPPIPVVGAVRSILTAALSAFVVLPALSLTDALALSPEPSPVIVLFAGIPAARPESASLAVQAMTTLPLYQPLAFAAVVGAPLSEGAVLSTLTPVTDAVVLPLSARSVAAPLADWSAPSARTTDAGHDLTPDACAPGSAQSKLTVTFVLFQPFALPLAGVRVAPIVGGVLSSLTVTESVATLFALSVAVPLTVVPLVSVLTVFEADAGLVPSATQVLTPEPPALSAHVNVTVASALFHPAAFGAGATA